MTTTTPAEAAAEVADHARRHLMGAAELAGHAEAVDNGHRRAVTERDRAEVVALKAAAEADHAAAHGDAAEADHTERAYRRARGYYRAADAERLAARWRAVTAALRAADALKTAAELYLEAARRAELAEDAERAAACRAEAEDAHAAACSWADRAAELEPDAED